MGLRPLPPLWRDQQVGISLDERQALLELSFRRASRRAAARLPRRSVREIMQEGEARLKAEKLDMMRDFYAELFRQKWCRRFERVVRRHKPGFRLGAGNSQYAASRLVRMIERCVGRDCRWLENASLADIQRHFDHRRQQLSGKREYSGRPAA